MPVSVHDLVDVDPQGSLIIITSALADEKKCVVFIAHGTATTVAGLGHDDISVLGTTKDVVWLHCCHAGRDLVVKLAQSWKRCVVGFTGTVLCTPLSLRPGMMNLLRAVASTVLPHLQDADLESRLKEEILSHGQALVESQRDLMAAAAVMQSAYVVKVARP